MPTAMFYLPLVVLLLTNLAVTLWREIALRKLRDHLGATDWIPLTVTYRDQGLQRPRFAVLALQPRRELAMFGPGNTITVWPLPDPLPAATIRDGGWVKMVELELAGNVVCLTAQATGWSGMHVAQKRLLGLLPADSPHLPQMFALEKSPACMAVLAGCVALMLFAVVDSFVINTYEFVDAPAVIMSWSPLGLLIAPPLWWYLPRRQVPPAETVFLSALLAVALACSVLPAMRRIEQWRSADGPQNYLYRLEKGTYLVPANAAADLPPLDFERTPEYWAQFPRGSTHSFRLLRGPWGYWQIDYSEIDEQHRAFYQR